MAATPDPIVLAPPKLIGCRTVALAFGVSAQTVRDLVHSGDIRVQPGYLGRISHRHVWNAHELFASMYTSPMALWDEIARIEHRVPATVWCAVGECEEPAHFLRLCPNHLRFLMKVWRRAERSTLAQWRLLAMCQWVVERNAHLTPPSGWDPWSGVCMTPRCTGVTDADGRSGPLCPECSAKFWNNEVGSRRGFGA